MIWTERFKLVVNSDNSLKFKNGVLEIEAICESY